MTLHRRDVLLLRATPRARVFDLRCERLYMQYVDIRRPRADGPPVQDYWLGEPEPEYEERGAEELFEGLANELRAADVLRIVGSNWLTDDELKRQVAKMVDAFRARGGRVEVA
jgi:hypothetical protein